MSGMRLRFCAAGLALAIALGGLAGCGGSEGASTGGDHAARPHPGRGTTSSPAPTREVSNEINLSAAEEAAARAMGRQACADKTAEQVAQQYLQAARRAGVTRRFGLEAAHPSASVASSPGYPRLVAALYARTVPLRKSAAAAAGCTEELAAREAGGRTQSHRAG